MSLEVCMAGKGKRSSLSLPQTTKDGLDSLKHSGQSYDGLIKELVEFRKEHEKEGGKD